MNSSSFLCVFVAMTKVSTAARLIALGVSSSHCWDRNWIHCWFGACNEESQGSTKKKSRVRQTRKRGAFFSITASLRIFSDKTTYIRYVSNWLILRYLRVHTTIFTQLRSSLLSLVVVFYFSFFLMCYSHAAVRKVYIKPGSRALLFTNRPLIT